MPAGTAPRASGQPIGSAAAAAAAARASDPAMAQAQPMVLPRTGSAASAGTAALDAASKQQQTPRSGTLAAMGALDRPNSAGDARPAQQSAKLGSRAPAISAPASAQPPKRRNTAPMTSSPTAVPTPQASSAKVKPAAENPAGSLHNVLAKHTPLFRSLFSVLDISAAQVPFDVVGTWLAPTDEVSGRLGGPVSRAVGQGLWCVHHMMMPLQRHMVAQHGGPM